MLSATFSTQWRAVSTMFGRTSVPEQVPKQLPGLFPAHTPTANGCAVPSSSPPWIALAAMRVFSNVGSLFDEEHPPAATTRATAVAPTPRARSFIRKTFRSESERVLGLVNHTRNRRAGNFTPAHGR